MNHRKIPFSTNIRGLLAAVVLIFGAVMMTSPAFALPSLQLGPDSSSDWTYVGGSDDTWYYNGAQPVTLNAYANAIGGNGTYAWDTAAGTNRYAYLVASTVPDLGPGDKFALTITNASWVVSDYGTPPIEDTNSIGPHGIYDTYFEIYEFMFDGPIVNISDQQPGESGTGQGYNEAFSISWRDLTGGNVIGIHFDLFTVAGNGKYIPGVGDKFLVNDFAPFSHDAQIIPPSFTPPSGIIPEPGTVALFSIGLLGMGLSHRRRRKAS